MKKQIDIETWNRKEHFLFFSAFTEPFFGVTVEVDCTRAYAKAKEQGVSFFLYYLYRAMKAANGIANFRYRIIDGQVYEYDRIDASPTIERANGTFGFSYMDYSEDEDVFYRNATTEIERVQITDSLLPAVSGENVIHFSVLPWIKFTSMSHARSFASPDSCPKMSFGKMTETDGVKLMPVSIHVHHALVDGYHVGQLIEQFQQLLDE